MRTQILIFLKYVLEYILEYLTVINKNAHFLLDRNIWAKAEF